MDALRRIFRGRRSGPAGRHSRLPCLAAAVAALWVFAGSPGSRGADSAPVDTHPSPGASVTLISFNILVTNQETAAVAAYLAASAADIVAIQEFHDRRHAPLLPALAERFPSRLDCPAGLVMLSALPVLDAGCRPIGADSQRQLAWMRVVVDQREATVVNTHLYHPFLHTPRRPRWHEWPAVVSAVLRNTERQSQQFDDVAAFVNAQHGPIIVLGDLNAFPGSPLLHRFMEDVGLAFGPVGLAPTHPAQVPVLAIDHVLAGRDAAVTARRTGPALGSDHLPVEAVVVLDG